MISRPRLGLLCAIAAVAFSTFVTTGSAAAAGAIEGEVADAVTEVGIEELEVCAVELEVDFFACVETGPDGEYVLENLPDGDYVVEFWAPYLGYVTQYFNGKASFEDADEVTIAGGGTMPNVNAKMERGGEIAGRVTDVLTGAGIEQAEVCALSETTFGRCALTDTAGNYALRGLASASYLVEFWAGFLGYEARYYNEVANFEDASLISVTAPNAVTGIDARLSKPGESLVVRPSSSPPVTPFPLGRGNPKPKAVKCRKGFKKVKRRGRKVCIKKHKHKKRHRS